MLFFVAFIVALVMTMALIPPLIRVAGKLQLFDQPDDRKVHVVAIPRVGGVGMVLGVLLPVLLWVPIDQATESLLVGIGILFVFGILDDRGDLDYRLKFLGQFLAATVVVGYGGIVIEVVPFFGMDPVSPWFSMPFTIIAIVAVTNSVNLADGLDGLAAGTMLLSLAGMGLLAYLADGQGILMVILAVMGAVVGFLRFNTYPARIFMGDTGSQFLGFVVVTLLIMLTQQTNPALNPALPLLLLGVPLFDTAFVIIRRMYYGKSPFVADKNHIHHQLLALNLDHYEAVVIIYLVQAFFVVSAVLLRYNSDLVIVSWWLLANITLVFFLVTAGRMRWHAHPPGTRSVISRILTIGRSRILCKVTQVILIASVSLLLLVGPLLADYVGRDIGISAGVLFLLLFFRQLLGYRVWLISLRLLMFVAVAFVLYLLSKYPSSIYLAGEGIEYAYFGLIIVALVIGARATDNDVFQATPMDFLVILIIVGLAFIPQARAGETDIIHLVIKICIMFYAVEFMLRNMESRLNIPALSALWAMGVFTVRGLFL